MGIYTGVPYSILNNNGISRLLLALIRHIHSENQFRKPKSPQGNEGKALLFSFFHLCIYYPFLFSVSGAASSLLLPTTNQVVKLLIIYRVSIKINIRPSSKRARSHVIPEPQHLPGLFRCKSPCENAIIFQVKLCDRTRYLSKDPSRFPIRTNRSTSDVLRGTSRVSADVKCQRQMGDGQVGSGSRTSRRNIRFLGNLTP